MWNAGLGEAQDGIKIARRNLNNCRYADDTTLMVESEEEITSLLKVKENSKKADWKLSIEQMKITASGPSLHGKEKGKKWTQWQILFSWSPKLLQTMTAVMKLKDACSLEGNYDKPRQYI